MKFKKGDSVRVKSKEYMDEDVNLGGWQGRVDSINDHWVLVEWDSVTLDQIPISFIRSADEEFLHYEYYNIEEHHLEPAVARDAPEDAEERRKTHIKALGMWGLDGLTIEQAASLTAQFVCMFKDFLSLHMRRDSKLEQTRDYRMARDEYIEICLLTDRMRDEMRVLLELFDCEIDIKDYLTERERKGLKKYVPIGTENDGEE